MTHPKIGRYSHTHIVCNDDDSGWLRRDRHPHFHGITSTIVCERDASGGTHAILQMKRVTAYKTFYLLTFFSLLACLRFCYSVQL